MQWEGEKGNPVDDKCTSEVGIWMGIKDASSKLTYRWCCFASLREELLEMAVVFGMRGVSY